MRCPFCGEDDTQVKDSRPTEDNTSIRRRRACPNCGGRFTTFERIQMRELTVIKRNGQRTTFERDKLVRSMAIALRKRPVEPDRVERVIKLLGMVNAVPDFTQHPQVINGCSELFRDVWGEDCGVGTRSAFGVSGLPAGACVEIEGILSLRE